MEFESKPKSELDLKSNRVEIGASVIVKVRIAVGARFGIEVGVGVMLRIKGRFLNFSIIGVHPG